MAIKKWLPNRFQLKAESSTSHSRRNTSNTIELRESRESPSKEKLLNTKRSSTPRESPSKGPSPTTTLSKPKSNTFPRKSNRPSSSMSPSKEPGNVFNICPSKPKSFTTQREKNMFKGKANTSLPHPQLSKIQEFTLPDTRQANTQQDNTELVNTLQLLTKPQFPTKQPQPPQLPILPLQLLQWLIKPTRTPPQLPLSPTPREPNKATRLFNLATSAGQELGRASSQVPTELDPTTCTLQEDPLRPAPTHRQDILSHWATSGTRLQMEPTWLQLGTLSATTLPPATLKTTNHIRPTSDRHDISLLLSTHNSFLNPYNCTL